MGTAKKGDVLGVARVAGIMGTKRTFEMIPMCHLRILALKRMHMQENGIVKLVLFLMNRLKLLKQEAEK